MKKALFFFVVTLFLVSGSAFAATDPTNRANAAQDRPCGYKSQFSSMQACLSAQRQCMDKWFWLNCDYSCESCWVPSTLTGLDPKINPLYTIFIDEYSNATYNMVYAIGDMFKQLVMNGYHCIIGGENRTSKCFKTLGNGAVIVVSVFYPPAGVAIFTVLVTYQGTQCIISASNPSAPGQLGDQAAKACAQLAASGATVITFYAGGVAYTATRPAAAGGGTGPISGGSRPSPGGSGSPGSMPKPPVYRPPAVAEPVAPPVRQPPGVVEPIPGGNSGKTIEWVNPQSPKFVRLQETVCRSIVDKKCTLPIEEIVVKAIRRPNGELWIYDGHHRWMAAIECGHPKIKVEIVTEAEFLREKGLAGEGISLEALMAMLELSPKPGRCTVVDEFVE